MLVIRLLRKGKKNQPSFKVVVAEKRRSAKSGRFIEELGFWNPLKKERKLKTERIKYWLSVGAKPSDTVYNFLISEKIIEGKKIPSHKNREAISAERLKSKKEEKPKPEEKAGEKPEEVQNQEEKPQEAEAAEVQPSQVEPQGNQSSEAETKKEI